MDLRKIHKHAPYDPNANRDVPKDFEVRHSEYTLRMKESGLRDIGEFNEIPTDTRKEFWTHLKSELPLRMQEDADKGALDSRDPVKAIQREIEKFRKDNPSFPKLTNEEVERLYQEI